VKKSQETFEDFFYWGDMLLNDFDDTDKYLADPAKLFRNVSDIRKIDQQFGGLTSEQAEAVKRFWINFDPERITNEKSGFISIWSVLEGLYKAFRASLNEKHIAYEGMIFRDVVEHESWKNPSLLKWEMVHFIGFNALNQCERSLMLSLKKEGRARFYWDYDDSYINETNFNSAGFFIKNNIKIFGNDLPDDWNSATLLSVDQKDVKRKVIDTSSDIAQVKLIPGLIGELPGITPENAHETAIILSDENLLMPVLSSLPDNIAEVNLTMGFPLKQTPVFTFVENILELQRNAKVKDEEFLFTFIDTINILKNPFISSVLDKPDQALISKIENSNATWIPSGYFTGSGLLSGIFTKALNPEMTSGCLKSALSLIVSSPDDEIINNTGNFFSRKGIRDEFIYRVMLSINRLDDAIKRSEIDITAESWMRILERLLRIQSVPFSGEPLSGLQIMGILETRALDFKNLILLSVNEGILPSATASASFIPYSLRDAFGLPSINHQESVFAYHFYRLLHRAENVTFIYNSNPDGLKTGEMSRFLQQMKYDISLSPEFLSSGFEIKNHDSIGTSLTRTEEHNRQLMARITKDEGIPYLSSTSLNTWLYCRMKFYYRYVNGLEEPTRSKEEIDPAMLGTLLHDILKNIYERHVGNMINARLIDAILSDRKELDRLIDQSLEDNFRNASFPYTAGNELIVKDVLLKYIERIIRTDKNYVPFTILGVEKSFRFRVNQGRGIEGTDVIAGGRIDRIDLKDGITRIVDYKTGSVADHIGSIGDLFIDDRERELDGWLQALFYCEGYLQSNPGIKIVPSIYKIKKTPGKLTDSRLHIKQNKTDGNIVNDYDSVRAEFSEGLRSIIRTVFSMDEPFVMTNRRWNKCGYCPYKVLCMR
jgi:CRISPR/Cas system-associated exonuclease Cas4 (RecB family)